MSRVCLLIQLLLKSYPLLAQLSVRSVLLRSYMQSCLQLCRNRAGSCLPYEQDT